MGKLIDFARRFLSESAVDGRPPFEKSDSKILSQKQCFRNDLSEPLEIMVEPLPDRYMLQPHQEIEIEFSYLSGQPALEVFVYDGGLWIGPGVIPLGVWIDGKPVEPDWKTAGPNAHQ